MERQSTGTGQLIAVCVCILWACSSSTLPVTAKKHGHATLVLYEHEDKVAPGKTVVTSATPSGNYSVVEFGTIKVFDNILTDGISIKNSTKLGKVVGQATFSSNLSLSLVYTFVLTTKSCAGTLTAQGLLDPTGNGEVAVTGGTGDFLFARGFAEVVVLSTDPVDLVFKTTFHLKY